MRLIERYLFQQLLGPTVMATLALTGVALLTSSLSALDLLVNQRQSLVIFAEVTLLAMPQIIALILPIALFVAALVALNRLHTEQEIVICFAGGMSRWRVASPAIRLTAFVMIFALAINLWIQPACFQKMRAILQAVRSDIASTMIKPGEFTHPSPGLTVYAQSMDDVGAIHNLFIYQTTVKGAASAITASEGRIAKRNGAPVLIMRNGSNQEFSRGGVLNFLSFDEYVFDLSAVTAIAPRERYKLSDRYPHELFFPDTTAEYAATNRDRLYAEGHSRIAGSLYSIAFMAMAFAAVVGGAFNRTGYGNRIAWMASAAMLTRTLGFAAEAASATMPLANVAQYGVPILATAMSFGILFAAPKTRRRGSQPATAALA